MATEQELPSRSQEEGAWGRPVSARRGEIVVAVILLATSAFFIWQSALLPFGTVRLPGPGFFPFALGIVLGVLATAILTLAWLDRAKDEVVYLGHRDILAVFAALLAVAPTFELLGAYASLGLFTATLLVLLAGVSPWRSVAAASVGMVAVWVFFKILLGVQLPAGPF